MSIHTAAMPKTIAQTSLVELSVEGVLEIFAVHRSTTPVSNNICAGRDGVFGNRAYWCPLEKQSDRGFAMFLAFLRVTSSLLQDMEGNPAGQDAIPHVFDLLSAPPPALRTLHFLGQGKTPSPSECASLSHSYFHVLETFMPEDLIGNTRRRLFEGSRLLFGFLLEEGRSVKLHEPQLANSQNWPYLGAFQTIEVRDSITNEPVMAPVQSEVGIVERALIDAFAPHGIVFSNPMQQNLSEGPVESKMISRTMLSGGTRAENSMLCHASLMTNYTYSDCGVVTNVMDGSDLHELQYLAELCGRNNLAVHRPSQLTSAVAPCLTFDRNAHVAVYLGEQACSEPGHSSLVFRPLIGVTETPDAAVVEQPIESIIKTYEAEGTSVFDTCSGATVRKLEAPDEILMFCVDCSASMRQKTDFAEVRRDEDEEEFGAVNDVRQPVIEGQYFSDVKYEDVKKELCKHESFNDVIAIIANAPEAMRQSPVWVVALDSICLGDELNTTLLAISDTLGCHKFAPFSLANALAICELETVLSLNARPDLVPIAKKSWARPTFKGQFTCHVHVVKPTKVNEHIIPPHEAHPGLVGDFILLADAASVHSGRAVTTTSSTRSDMRVSRLANEMRQIVAGGPRETYDIYLSETDIAFWVIVMQGPSGMPYEGGTLMLYLHAEERYPAFAPKTRFVTRIKHPNVSLEGRICHGIFSRDYTTDTSMTRLLDTVYGMLLQAEASDPVNTTTTLGYHHDQVKFNDQARRWTRKYAKGMTRAAWRDSILADGMLLNHHEGQCADDMTMTMTKMIEAKD